MKSDNDDGYDNNDGDDAGPGAQLVRLGRAKSGTS